MDKELALSGVSSVSGTEKSEEKDKCCYTVFGCCIRGEKVFKECLEKVFFQTKIGRYMERLNGLLMIGSAIFYVGLSYAKNLEGILEDEMFNMFDKVMCSMFLFLYFIKFYVSQNRKDYCKQILKFAELLVAIPILVIGTPDLFSSWYLLIIFSRYMRFYLGAYTLMAN
jgi:hypothetical protein